MQRGGGVLMHIASLLGPFGIGVLGEEAVEYCCCLFDNKNEPLILVYTGDADFNDLKSALSQRIQDYMLPAIY